MTMARPSANAKSIDALTHTEYTRKNIPSAELAPVMRDEDRAVKTLRYPRNSDLDPQLVWRGKDEQDGDDLRMRAPPTCITISRPFAFARIFVPYPQTH
jgi:adenine-specific DNA-methyltransferase